MGQELHWLLSGVLSLGTSVGLDFLSGQSINRQQMKDDLVFQFYEGPDLFQGKITLLPPCSRPPAHCVLMVETCDFLIAKLIAAIVRQNSSLAQDTVPSLGVQ